MVKVIGEDNDYKKKEQLIRNEWVAFTKTTAFKDLKEYVDTQQAMLLNNAQDLSMPHPNGKEKMPITGEIANYLLQNRRGMDIVMTYIRLRSE